MLGISSTTTWCECVDTCGRPHRGTAGADLDRLPPLIWGPPTRDPGNWQLGTIRPIEISRLIEFKNRKQKYKIRIPRYMRPRLAARVWHHSSLCVCERERTSTHHGPRGSIAGVVVRLSLLCVDRTRCGPRAARFLHRHCPLHGTTSHVTEKYSTLFMRYDPCETMCKLPKLSRRYSVWPPSRDWALSSVLVPVMNSSMNVWGRQTSSCPRRKLDCEGLLSRNRTSHSQMIPTMALTAWTPRERPWFAAIPDRVIPAACEVLEALFPLRPAGDPWLADIMRRRRWRPATRDGADPTRFYPNRSMVMQDLYENSTGTPYDGVKAFSHRERIHVEGVYRSQGQQAASRLHETVLSELGGPPSLILEVGSFIGSAAVHTWAPLAKKFKNANGPGLVICADTWQGALMMRLGSHSKSNDFAVGKIMSFRNGFPDIGSIFMRRVVSSRLTDVIFPLPLTSLLTARLLYLLGYRVDLIYLDSAHELGETLIELHLFYLLLRPGGLLMGDDHHWKAVAHDLRAFARCHNVSVVLVANTSQQQWYVKKPLLGR